MHVSQIDSIIPIEILHLGQDPLLLLIVRSCVIHEPCLVLNAQCSYMLVIERWRKTCVFLLHIQNGNDTTSHKTKTIPACSTQNNKND